METAFDLNKLRELLDRLPTAVPASELPTPGGRPRRSRQYVGGKHRRRRALRVLARQGLTHLGDLPTEKGVVKYPKRAP